MKKYLPYGAALAILGLAAAPLIAQTQIANGSSSSGYIQTSKIIGTKVKTQQGEEVGVVKDVVLDRSNGCMAYTVLSADGSGSRVTSQSKLVAVPWSVFTVSPDMTYLITTVERDRIYNAPVFEYSRIGDTTFTTSVYSAFGVSAGVGVSNATTTGVSTTTAAQTQNQPNASASPNASAAAGATASPGVSASPSVGASASASPAATASASPKSHRGAKSEKTPAPSARHTGDETMQGTGGTSSSEATGASSSTGAKSSKGSKKSSNAEKSPGTESSAETAESPSNTKSPHKKSGKTEGTQTEPSPGGEPE